MPGIGGVRIENEVLVAEGSQELITRFGKRLADLVVEIQVG